MKRINYIFFLIFLATQVSVAQTGYLPLGELSYDIFERQAILNNDQSASHLGVYPILRKDIFQLSDSLSEAGVFEDQLDYLSIENIEFSKPLNVSLEKRGMFGKIYQYPGRFVYVSKPNFGVVVNPLLNVRYSTQLKIAGILFFRIQEV